VGGRGGGAADAPPHSELRRALDFELSGTEQLLADTARRVVARDVEPVLAAHPPDRALPKAVMLDLYRVAAGLGYTGARIPQAEGGGAAGPAPTASCRPSPLPDPLLRRPPPRRRRHRSRRGRQSTPVPEAEIETRP